MSTRWISFLRPARSVPTTVWSAPSARTFRPSLRTFLILQTGLWIFGTGEAFFIAAGLGVSPWTVLAQGLSLQTGWSVGVSTFVVSVAVLLLWWPLRERPGLGTLSNAVVIAIAIDVMTPVLSGFESDWVRPVWVLIGVALIGLGSGLYLTANLGPGPRDGLMTGIQRRSGKPIGWVRAGIEILVLVAGWFLGGSVGVGTVVFALGVGHSVAIFLSFMRVFSMDPDH
ncbi:MAG: YczE/YyaS/YitT family protein [Arenicellales bacterium]